MKKAYYLIIPLLLLSCNDNLVVEDILSQGEVELTQINAIIASSDNIVRTRAEGEDPTPNTPTVVYLEDHISRFRFVDKDRMTFTKFQRSSNPINRFTYNDIAFENNASGAWDRDKNTGGDALNGSSSHPARIYWSDATSIHTFIGYSLPQQIGANTFDWTLDTSNKTTYYGSIGVSTETSIINYNPSVAEIDFITVKENGVEKKVSIPASSLMRAEDLLLAFDEEVVSEASVANIKFYHGLSSIKVRLILSDFYGSELDGYTKVDSMVLLNQPTLYRWEQTSYKAAARSNIHRDNNPRNMMLWDYTPGGIGENAGKTFIFYGITVPQENGYQMQDLKLNFRVRYPDPLRTDLVNLKKEGKLPNYWLEKEYSATIPASPRPVYFHPNQCTIITIKLNHKDEAMTIGAQYTDWEFVPTPDEGNLKKNSTFLQSAPAFESRPTINRVTVASDEQATEDDATWLYYKKEGTEFVIENGERVLLDIYGNTGTKEKPYTISTANQLLSLAYEVSNGGNNFAGKYIKLDAGIVMQQDNDSESVTWLGIGTQSNPFQGTFLGSERKISRLKGAPLFNYVGESALIDKVVIENPLMGPETITQDGATVNNSNYGKLQTGHAVLAENNAGVICACRVNGDVGCSPSDSVGSLVGTNSGTIFACHHIGLVKGEGSVSGLVGSNTGSILFSYHSGELVGSSKYGIAPSGTITDCYYDSKLATVVAVGGVAAVPTSEMQKRSFVDDVYTEADAESENSKEEHLAVDTESRNPGDEGYVRTYKEGYTPVKAGDPNPDANAWNTRMRAWINALADSDNLYPQKKHFLGHSYLYQPASYPKIQ